jgi:hypothetical protein
MWLFMLLKLTYKQSHMVIFISLLSPNPVHTHTSSTTNAAGAASFSSHYCLALPPPLPISRRCAGLPVSWVEPTQAWREPSEAPFSSSSSLFALLLVHFFELHLRSSSTGERVVAVFIEPLVELTKLGLICININIPRSFLTSYDAQTYTFLSLRLGS